MKLLFRTIVLIYTALLFGCGEKDVTKIEMEIILSGKIANTSTEKYPKNLQAITAPLGNICKEEKNIAFYPLTIRRLDLGKTFDLDYQTNKAVNYSKIKAVERNLKNYFRDSTVLQALVEPVNTSFNISDFINANSKKDNYFIFSTDESFAPNNIPVSRTTEELRTAIAKAICEKAITKAYVIYEPGTQTININKQPEDTTINTSIPTNTGQLEESQINKDLLKKILKEISNPQLSFAARKAKANDAIKKIFTPDFNVIMHEGDSTANPMVWERNNGIKYLSDRLTTDDSILDFQIIRADKNINDPSKYSHLEVVEIHKTD